VALIGAKADAKAQASSRVLQTKGRRENKKDESDVHLLFAAAPQKKYLLTPLHGAPFGFCFYLCHRIF
jgi:hypothetical protein